MRAIIQNERLVLGLLAAFMLLLTGCNTAAPIDVDTEAKKKGFWDCPVYLPRSESGKRNGIEYSSDASGRPTQAFLMLDNKRSKGVRAKCQTEVGNLFGEGTAKERARYDGGHIIGAQLGGWGKRANMIPQNAQFNQNNWKAIETAAAKCTKADKVYMRVQIGYPGKPIVKTKFPDPIVPETMLVLIDHRRNGSRKFVREIFDNESGGGPSGKKKADRVVNWLRNVGKCT